MKKRSEQRVEDYRQPEKGQVGVVILLLTVVLLTIGLSIATRSVTDVRLSRQEEETSRAFDVAEAGIEDALRQDLAALVGVVGCCSVTVGSITADYTVNEEFVLETEIDEGETVEVNLRGFAGTQVSIEWATESCPNAASIVVAVFRPATDSVRRMPYKGCNQTPDDFFSSANSLPITPGYQFRQLENVSFAAGEEFMRVRAVYNGTRIRIDSSNPGPFPLPEQLWRIHSEARTSGGETRAVEVTKTLPAPPSIFDFVLFSGGDLTK